MGRQLTRLSNVEKIFTDQDFGENGKKKYGKGKHEYIKGPKGIQDTAATLKLHPEIGEELLTEPSQGKMFSHSHIVESVVRKR